MKRASEPASFGLAEKQQAKRKSQQLGNKSGSFRYCTSGNLKCTPILYYEQMRCLLANRMDTVLVMSL